MSDWLRRAWSRRANVADGWSSALGLGLVFLATVVVSAVLVRLPAGPSVGFDSAATVIHFQRITGGEQLEAFVTTTPKPLLTLVFGALHFVGDWFAVAVATVLVFAAAVTLAAWLGMRLGGPISAGFAATALVGLPLMLEDVGKSYAVAWALILWLIAAAALAAPRPRYWLVGFALLAASLIRFETLVVVPGGVGVVLIAALSRRPRGSPVQWHALAAVLVPLLAIPIMALHDWLLTGDPLFWASVSTRFAEVAQARGFRGLSEVTGRLVDRYIGGLGFILLAGIGCVRLWRARQWPLLGGIVLFALGNVAFQLLMATRGLFVSSRYLLPIDVVIVVAAAIGIGVLQLKGGPSLTQPAARRLAGPFAGVLGGLVAIAVSDPYGPLNDATQNRLREEARLQRNVSAAVPIARAALDRNPGSRDPVPGSSWHGSARAASLVVLVPDLTRPRLAVDLDVPLSRIDQNTGLPNGPTAVLPLPGQVLIHDRRADRPAAAYAFLEIATPTPLGDVLLVPLLADPERGLWVIEVRAPG